MKFQRHFATSGNLNDICEKIRAAAKFGLGAEQTRINLVDLESQKIGFDAAENKPSKIRAVATPPFPASKTNARPASRFGECSGSGSVIGSSRDDMVRGVDSSSFRKLA